MTVVTLALTLRCMYLGRIVGLLLQIINEYRLESGTSHNGRNDGTGQSALWSLPASEITLMRANAQKTRTATAEIGLEHVLRISDERCQHQTEAHLPGVGEDASRYVSG